MLYRFFVTGDAEFLKSITLSIRMTAFFLGVSANLVSEYYPSIDEETAEILLNFLFKVMKNLQSCYVVSSTFVMSFC